MIKVFIYTSIVEGGIGLVGLTDPNTLIAAIQSSEVSPGDSGLAGLIRAIRSGEDSFYGYIRSAASGSLDLSATLSGFVPINLYAAIRPSYTGSLDLNTFIEPIPGVDLSGNYLGVIAQDLGGVIEPIAGVNLSGTISGVPYSDLLATLYGFEISDLGATYSGSEAKNLQAIIDIVSSGTASLSGIIQGFYAINEEQTISGYIVPASGSQSNISGTIVGLSFKDLYGTILGSPSGVDLPATVSGQLFDGALIGTITGVGDIANLYAYIRDSSASNNTLIGQIDGYLSSDLIAIYNNDIANSPLHAIISPSGVVSYLNATINPNIATTISATYDVITGNLLNANIDPIAPDDLYATIAPKVFYIDSSIPINTYDFLNLKAVINADICQAESAFLNLGVIISGVPFSDLQASVIGVQGQYAITTDEFIISTENFVNSEDWIFLIAKSPIMSETTFPIILTNSPLKDLYATILGVQTNSDLTATVSPIYVPSVTRDGVPLGEWLNTKTGDRKLIKLLFSGDVNNFYYSSISNTTYAQNANDTLTLIVETYKRIATTDTSLLAQKTDVRQCIVDNLQDFASIDDAIKYAIKCSVHEISSTLRAEITAIGGINSINATVSGLGDNYLKDLASKIVATANDPILSGTINPTGDISSLYSYIMSSLHTGMTFLGTDGSYYFPELILNEDDQYSIVLTKVVGSGILNTVIPDLYASINPLYTEGIDATVSGI